MWLTFVAQNLFLQASTALDTCLGLESAVGCTDKKGATWENKGEAHAELGAGGTSALGPTHRDTPDSASLGAVLTVTVQQS